MRQIYLLASEADADSAGEVELMLRERGYMVRRAEEKFAYPPARRDEVTLALWSHNVQFSPKQILFTNRAIDAWTEGRLIFARLDHSILPRGLSDVGVVDLSFAPARVATIWKIIEAAQEIDRAMEARRREGIPEPEDDVPEPAARPAAKEREARAFSAGHALIFGFVTTAALLSLGFLAMPQASNLLVGIAAVSWGAVAGAVAGYRGGAAEPPRPKAARAPRAAPPPQAPALEETAAAQDGAPGAADAPVFVSYSRRDGHVVYPMVAEVEAGGREVWIDKDEIHAGGNWAGMIVRAIRESDTFCLMCSAEAFQSDNVRREIYIADKYKRKLLPVRLDSSEMPEDFEYFLIDRQWLDLTAVDPAERGSRLMAALIR